MKIVILEGKYIDTIKDFHKEIARLLDFGEFYGENLDALWDFISTVDRPILIIWKNHLYSKEKLGNDFNKIIEIFEKVKEEDRKFKLKEKFNFILQ